MFCSDVIARGVAERGRSRTIRPERSRQFTALSSILLISRKSAAMKREVSKLSSATQAGAGGVGSQRPRNLVAFALSGTSRKRMRAEGLLALKRLGYEGKGEITVISDGEDCLKRLKLALPQPAKHILDWFHIAMKLRPIEQTAGWLARRLPPNEREELLEDIAAVRWRLWNGQTDRAIDLIGRLFQDLKADEQGSSAIAPLRGGLLNLRIYIEQNRGSITNYGARYREGGGSPPRPLKRTSTILSQGGWSRSSKCAGQYAGQTCSFKFAWPLPMAILPNVSPTGRQFNQVRPSFHHSCRYRSFSVPHDPS